MIEVDVRTRSSLPLKKSDVRCLGMALVSGSLERMPFEALPFQFWASAHVERRWSQFLPKYVSGHGCD